MIALKENIDLELKLLKICQFNGRSPFQCKNQCYHPPLPPFLSNCDTVIQPFNLVGI